MIPTNSFNFKHYDYEVIFEEFDTNWVERLLTGKSTKLLYTIRERGSLRPYFLSSHKTFSETETSKIWWNNPTDPQNEIIRAKCRQSVSSDNVVFSSKDLN